jgi:nucleoside phosphorylase
MKHSMASTTTAADFTVGWICALPIELAAAGEMLDEEYDQMIQPPTDTNIYTFGRVGVHKVVVACLPAGQMGTTSAAAVASQMRNSFPGLRFGLLVGIGGGVPSVDNDIRLGDVVISQPVGQYGGVVQFDMGKTGVDGRVARTGNLNAPPAILLNALAKLRANYIRGRTAISKHLTTENTEFANPGSQEDTLYVASSQHITGVNCAKCNLADLVKRTSRNSQHPALFFGNIASGNQVMKDGPTRDRISQELGGAGLMNNLPCLIIRGICDYADAHKNKRWQPYAAATAAACAKELLNIVPVAVPLLEPSK